MKAAIISDQELIGKYLSGNEKSLEKLIFRHKRKVYSYIMMVVKDDQLADDIFQDTFIKVINTIRSGSYKEEGKFIQWVIDSIDSPGVLHISQSSNSPLLKLIALVATAPSPYTSNHSVSSGNPSFTLTQSDLVILIPPIEII